MEWHDSALQAVIIHAFDRTRTNLVSPNTVGRNDNGFEHFGIFMVRGVTEKYFYLCKVLNFIWLKVTLAMLPLSSY